MGWPRVDSPPRKGPGADPIGQSSPWEAVFGFWNPLPDHRPVPPPPDIPMGRPTAVSLLSSAQWLFFIQGESQGAGTPLGLKLGHVYSPQCPALRTPPNFILQRGPEALSCCLQRPREESGLSVCLQSLLAQWTGASVLI